MVKLHEHEEFLTDLSFSPDGLLLTSRSWGGTVRTWDSKSGICLEVAPEGENHITTTGTPLPGQLHGEGQTLETKIVATTTGTPVAWFPANPIPLLSHPSGRTWASIPPSWS
jgi:WD40 repeat protein